MQDVIGANFRTIGALPHIGRAWRKRAAARMCASAQIQPCASVRLAVSIAHKLWLKANFGAAVEQIPAMQSPTSALEPLFMEIDMNWDVIQGNWAQYKGQVKAQWGKLTNDHIDVINGKREQLTGQLQASYGIAHEEADKQVTAFQKFLRDSQP
jgi:uncharacterized protein YjbJ (UPF0337 family)